MATKQGAASADSGSILAAALEYARRGWPILPVSQAKQPFIKAWPTAASTDESQVRSWWKQHPEANVGLVTGQRSGLLAVDVDPRNITDLKAVAAILDALPRTRAHSTGGGGRHYLFRHVPGTKNGSIMPGIDIKADAGFIVAPPSIHDSGKAYSVSDSSPVAELPPELAECLPRKATSAHSDRKFAASPPRGQGIDAKLEAALLARGGQRSGDELKFSCLFHADRLPSCSYNTAKRAFQCFACGQRGTWWKLSVRLGLLQDRNSPHRREIRRIASLAESAHWTGVKGSTEREVLLAHARIAHRANRRDGYTASARQVAELAGKDKETTIRAQRQLRLAGWLHLHRCQCGDAFCQRLGTGRGHSVLASTWSVSFPKNPSLSQFPYTKYSTPVLGNSEKIMAEIRDTAHDAFRWRGLGPNGRKVLGLLEQRTWKASNLARAASVHRWTVGRMLRKLKACGAAVETSDGWRRGPASLDDIAEHLGTAQTGARQRARHQAERAVYRQMLEVEPKKRLVLVPSEDLATPPPLERNRTQCAGGDGSSSHFEYLPVDKISARAESFERDKCS